MNSWICFLLPLSTRIPFIASHLGGHSVSTWILLVFNSFALLQNTFRVRKLFFILNPNLPLMKLFYALLSKHRVSLWPLLYVPHQNFKNPRHMFMVRKSSKYRRITVLVFFPPSFPPSLLIEIKFKYCICFRYTT